ncbi:MAG: GlsB/YeaQ/YmgE family stress response membrane protein [Chloroflexi bacterium]|nr:GlsB/YeaQ/YmgE family stress response membrane protein [Chloroflexota bacterium]MBU1879712.1 GlsB/YeaQ/YmgE family stress response membrane protein [Chloroflexota bacterium]
MGLLAWLVVGLIAGFLAGLFVKGSGFGLIGDIIVGVVGALVGGWLAATFLNMPDAITGFNLTTIVVAFVGAVILLLIVRLFSRARR